MSDFDVRVVRIGAVRKHPNADALSITTIGGDGGYDVIFKTGDYQEGDKAVYVPVAAAVPVDDPRWAFMVRPGVTKTHLAIEAKRLRGEFSRGILTPADPSWEVGRDVATELRIVRADATDADTSDGIDHIHDPGLMPAYTDIDGIQKWPRALADDEEVVLTEKIHGENARYCIGADGTLYCGSRTRWKNPACRGPWVLAGEEYDLANRLAKMRHPIGLYGELYGNNAGMRYDGAASARKFRLFDIMDLRTRTYLDFDDFTAVAMALDIPTVPILYLGPWSNDIRSYADGASTINGAHTREGFVVRPTKERTFVAGGEFAPVPHQKRCILKFHCERYLLKQWDMAKPLDPTKGRKGARGG
jgi:RNA ligase (TIGR02306 family)